MIDKLDKLRTKGYALLASRAGDKLRPVRVARAAAHFVNDLLGRPLAPETELADRRAYAERMAEREAAHAAAKAAAPKVPVTAAAAAPREAAPVVVYTDGQSHRDLKRIADVFKGRDIPWIERSVVEDEATLSWVRTTARTKELPVVFIAGDPIGGLNEVVALDSTGELVKRVFDAAPARTKH